jgi:hypothetical protein
MAAPKISIKQNNELFRLQINDAFEQVAGGPGNLGSIGNGMVAKTATDTFAARTITAGTGISVADGDGVAGNPTVTASLEYIQDSVAAMLVAGANITLTYDDTAGTLTVAATGGSVSITGNGLVSNNAGTLTGRTLTAGSGMSVSNGDGVSGNPTVTLALTEALMEAALTNVSFGNAQLQINSTKVVGAQQAAIADATTGPNAILRLNDLLAACRTHGLIAT